MESLQNLIIALMLFLNSFIDPLGVEITIKSNPIVAIINNKSYTDAEYNILRSDLKSKIVNRNIIKLNNVQLIEWQQVINKELKSCKLQNITKLDIDTINRCL